MVLFLLGFLKLFFQLGYFLLQFFIFNIIFFCIKFKLFIFILDYLYVILAQLQLCFSFSKTLVFGVDFVQDFVSVFVYLSQSRNFILQLLDLKFVGGFGLLVGCGMTILLQFLNKPF